MDRSLNSFLFFILLYVATPLLARGYECQLNIRGQEICLQHKVLREVSLNAEEKALYQQGRIERFYYPRVVVKEKNTYKNVDIDSLYPEQSCDYADNICIKDKVVISDNCRTEEQKTYSVKKIYGNHFAEIVHKNLNIFRKNEVKILEIECLELKI